MKLLRSFLSPKYEIHNSAVFEKVHMFDPNFAETYVKFMNVWFSEDIWL